MLGLNLIDSILSRTSWFINKILFIGLSFANALPLSTQKVRRGGRTKTRNEKRETNEEPKEERGTKLLPSGEVSNPSDLWVWSGSSPVNRLRILASPQM